MALVLLKKLKQSQELPPAREVSTVAVGSTTSLGGGATLTATRLTGGKVADAKQQHQALQRQNSANNDLLNTDKLVRNLAGTLKLSRISGVA